MIRDKKNRKNKIGTRKKYAGSVLAYMMIMLTIVSMILVSILQYIASQIKLSTHRIDQAESFQIAESGVYYYRWYLAHNVIGKTASQIDTFWNSGSALGVTTPLEVDFKDPEGGVIGHYSITVTPPSNGSTVVYVASTGWTYREPTVKSKIKIRLRRPSWSENTVLSDSTLSFGTQSEVYGKIFSNAGVRFDGLAHNTISSAVASYVDTTCGSSNQFGVHTTVSPADPSAPSYPWADGAVPNRPDVFLGGRTFPSSEVSFSGVASDLANMKYQANNGNGKDLGDDPIVSRRIILKSDGTYDVCTIASLLNSSSMIPTTYKKTSGSGTCSSCSGTCAANFPIPNNGVIYSAGSLWVDGIISNKRVTIVAANLTNSSSSSSIYLGTNGSNIRYSAYNCSNKLGLVAQKDILVLNSCPTNYTIDAVFLNQLGVVGINKASMATKGVLNINGSISSFLSPFFVSGTSGFTTRNYNFDNDLLYCPPPYFPTTSEYSIDHWEEL